MMSPTQMIPPTTQPPAQMIPQVSQNIQNLGSSKGEQDILQNCNSAQLQEIINELVVQLSKNTNIDDKVLYINHAKKEVEEKTQVLRNLKSEIQELLDDVKVHQQMMMENFETKKETLLPCFSANKNFYGFMCKL